ncbi:hypothetical protein OOK13_29910 [Streptomyces sp. NBC_00378]|uniref:hypothetical protein n=1 Tax=unclassified Streptomyces TaxID=2593676 RepID=UPI00224CF333|nr:MULTISPECIES: hypothetical protein [unclassified Streptomyces]MCX5112608.1 hypothetical protein [Streptomyces sp. NBC_00378]
MASAARERVELSPSPGGILALVVLLSLAVGALAATLPARRAAALSPLEAVAQT